MVNFKTNLLFTPIATGTGTAETSFTDVDLPSWVEEIDSVASFIDSEAPSVAESQVVRLTLQSQGAGDLTPYQFPAGVGGPHLAAINGVTATRIKDTEYLVNLRNPKGGALGPITMQGRAEPLDAQAGNGTVALQMSVMNFKTNLPLKHGLMNLETSTGTGGGTVAGANITLQKAHIMTGVYIIVAGSTVTADESFSGRGNFFSNGYLGIPSPIVTIFEPQHAVEATSGVGVIQDVYISKVIAPIASAGSTVITTDVVFDEAATAAGLETHGVWYI